MRMTGDTNLDWSMLADPEREGVVATIDEAIAARTDSFDRVARLAAEITASAYSQISLIGKTQFVPAAHGLVYGPDEQHTPRDHSLCSVTMASGGTLAIERTKEHRWVRDLPPVTSGAVGSYLGVPLVLPDGTSVGALCSFDQIQRAWSDSDRSALEDLAALVTRELGLIASLQSLQSSEVMLRQIIADMLDRPGFNDEGQTRAAARYRVAADAPAGGDWVDWTVIDEHRLTFGIGDVAGHGPGTVVTMDDLRHTLRAFAVEGSTPSEVLRRADTHLRKVAPGAMATAMKISLDLRTGEATVASAGHVNPILVTDGRPELVAITPGPPLGTGVDERPETRFHVGAGSRLILMTDGLFERRDEPVDESLQRVIDAVAASCGTSVDEMADHLIALCDRDDTYDDACVLVVERPHDS